jgi:hypothetical protein
MGMWIRATVEVEFEIRDEAALMQQARNAVDDAYFPEDRESEYPKDLTEAIEVVLVEAVATTMKEDVVDLHATGIMVEHSSTPWPVFMKA